MVTLWLLYVVNMALRVTPSIGIVCMVVPLQNQLFTNKTSAVIPQNLANKSNTPLNGMNITLGDDTPISDCVQMEKGKIDLGYEVKTIMYSCGISVVHFFILYVFIQCL